MAQNKEEQIVENSSIEQSLKQIANCLAYFMVNSGEIKDKSRPEAMGILLNLGFDRQSIAAIFQTSPEVVSQSLYMLRSSKKAVRAKKPVGNPNEENQPGTIE
jgi:hypothetical protein